jgi:hypothetical protein
VAITAGSWHSLALKSDGTVVAWGSNEHGERIVPSDLSSAIAVAAGYDHGLSLGWVTPTITSPLTLQKQFGQPFTYQMSSTYADAFGASGLPAGVTFDPATATISGAVAATGTYSITLSATNVAGSSSATLTLTIAGINQPPSFTKGPDIVVPEDSGYWFRVDWATACSPGPGESWQTISYHVTTDNPGLFAPTLAPQAYSAGAIAELLFMPAANANGVAHVTIVAQDDGGTANGGLDTSPPQTFTITVTPVNDAPTATNVAARTTMTTPLNAALAATDVDGDPLTYQIVTGPAHGTLSLNGTNATYTPETGFLGVDTFSYRVNDGTVDSNTATVTITVTLPPGGNIDDRVGSPTPETGGRGCGVGGAISAALASLMLAGMRRQRRAR